MIAGCRERIRQGACGTCEHRKDCTHFWPEALSFLKFSGRRRPMGEGGSSRIGRSSLSAFLVQVARAVETSAKRREAPFRHEVEKRLEPLLASGTIRMDQVARDLGYSRQTLYRRLKAEDTTFEKILDDLRHRLALRLVREQGLSVKEVAWRLGFSDPTAFSRAFKRWTGASPRTSRGS